VFFVFFVFFVFSLCQISRFRSFAFSRSQTVGTSQE
jgi:hypothetical protein